MAERWQVRRAACTPSASAPALGQQLRALEISALPAERCLRLRTAKDKQRHHEVCIPLIPGNNRPLNTCSTVLTLTTGHSCVQAELSAAEFTQSERTSAAPSF